MSLDEAKASLEALPGVYEVNTFIARRGPDVRPEHVKICVHCRSPEILPEETRQGILRVHSTLERELGCVVSLAVSAGLRMPSS